MRKRQQLLMLALAMACILVIAITIFMTDYSHLGWIW